MNTREMKNLQQAADDVGTNERAAIEKYNAAVALAFQHAARQHSQAA